MFRKKSATPSRKISRTDDDLSLKMDTDIDADNNPPSPVAAKEKEAEYISPTANMEDEIEPMS